MKKLIISLIVLTLSAVPVMAQDWGTDVWTPSQQYQQAIRGRAILDGVTQQLEQVIPEFQAMLDSGQFNTLPAWAKQALLRWFNILKAARNNIAADAEILRIYEFRP